MESRKASMNLDISEEERNLLLELIQSAEEAAIQSMDHADSRSFKTLLRKRLELLSTIKEKVRSCHTRAA
jgi:hypothetical protein